jgi:uncharacterized protein YecT (DUF1311 family)
MKTLSFSAGLLFALLAFDAARILQAAKPVDWPAGYKVDSDTVSPDECYGVVIPSREAAQDDTVDAVNYLADLKAHRLLGKIKGSDYFEHQNHRGLSVVWADDSSWAVIEYDNRFGFASITVVEPHKTDFSQSEVGKFIQSSLNGIIAKEEKVKGADCFGEFFCRLTADGRVKVRALGSTNPKQLGDVEDHCAFFQGTYDQKAGRWKVSDAQRLTDQYDALETLYRWNTSIDDCPTLKGWAEELDKALNEVYDALRFLIPTDRFAQVKKEQIAWLKKRDAADSLKAKCELIKARIEALQELGW